MGGVVEIIYRICAKFSHKILDVGAEAGGSITYSFKNTSHRDIFVVDRNNEVMLVEKAHPNTDTSEPGLTIKVNRGFRTRGSSQAIGHLTNVMGNRLYGLNKLHDDTLEVLGKSPISASGCIDICREFFIPVKTLENNATVFEQHTGLQLTVDPSLMAAMHPESLEYRMMNQNAAFLENQPVGRLFEIVDNFRQHKERFVFVGNEVLRIDHTVDNDREDGLYVTEVVSKGGARSISKTTRYDFEEGYKKFGLYLTREEAATAGDPGLAHQRTIEELKTQLAVRQAEEAVATAERKAAMERESFVQKNFETVSKQQDVMLNNEMRRYLEEQRVVTEEMKNKRDRDEIRRETEFSAYSSNLRSTSEFLKYVPGILAGAAAIAAGFMLFFKK